MNCSSSCLTCNGGASNNCLSCASGKFLDANHNCSPCDINCETCQNSATNCLSCINNLLLASVNSLGFCQCQTNQILDLSGTICNPCDSKCSSCSGIATNCISCTINYLLTTKDGIGTCCLSNQYVDSTYQCVDCSNNCKTCATSPDDCLSCWGNMALNSGTCTCLSNQYFQLNSSSCENCNSNCLTCSGSASNCSSCTSSFSLKMNNGVGTCCQSNQIVDASNICQNCDAICQTCETSPKYCLSCYNNMILNQQNVCSCSQSQYYDISTNSCLDCDKSCISCAGTSANCTSCNNNYILLLRNSQGRCCLSEQFIDSNQICQNCDPNCKTCEMISTHCMSCYSNLVLQNGICSCFLNQYFDSGSCMDCDSRCNTCSGSATNCSSCPDSLQLFVNTSTNQGMCCLSNQYIDSNNQCQNCSRNCKTCMINPENCLSCYGNQVVHAGTCPCLTNEYWDSNGLVCRSCDHNCLTCSNTAANCSSCDSNIALMIKNSIGTCCLLTQYVDTNQICRECNSNCKTCETASTNCLSCNGNLHLQDGACTCLNNQYYDAGSCLDCSSQCGTCLGSASNCTSCSFSSNVLAVRNNVGTCCLSNQYADARNACHKCDHRCKECTGPSNSDCISCEVGYLNISDVCENSCLPHQYYDMSKGACIDCNDSCLTCSGETECLSCKGALLLKDGQCLGECPTLGFFSDKAAGKCISCHDSCLTCSTSSEKGCLSCKKGYFLLQSECVLNCPSKYLTNRTNNSCDEKNDDEDNLLMRITDINNPYKFLLVLLGRKSANVTIQMHHLLEQITLNLSVMLSNKNPVRSSILPSGINSSSYLLLFDYPNGTELLSSKSPLMTINFENSNDAFFVQNNNNLSVQLVKSHNCQENLEYYDELTDQCVKKFVNDFMWTYGETNNEILLNFLDLDANLIKKIMEDSLLVISIDGLNYQNEYKYSLSNKSNTISLLFNYSVQVIGGPYLHISLRQSIYMILLFENKTYNLENRNYDIKLLDYYFLTVSQIKMINSTAILVGSMSEASSAALYASILMSPGSSFEIRGMMLMNIIQLLKYLDIAYPPNLVEIFKKDDKKYIFKDGIIEEKNINIPRTFILFNVSASLLNNSFEDFFFILIFLSFGLITCCLLKSKNIMKNTFKLLELFLIILRNMFVWNSVLMICLSKYLKFSVFVFLYMHYHEELLSPIYELFFSLFCLIFVVFFPPHVGMVIKNISLFPIDESAKIAPRESSKASITIKNNKHSTEKDIESINLESEHKKNEPISHNETLNNIANNHRNKFNNNHDNFTVSNNDLNSNDRLTSHQENKTAKSKSLREIHPTFLSYDPFFNSVVQSIPDSNENRFYDHTKPKKSSQLWQENGGHHNEVKITLQNIEEILTLNNLPHVKKDQVPIISNAPKSDWKPLQSRRVTVEWKEQEEEMNKSKKRDSLWWAMKDSNEPENLRKSTLLPQMTEYYIEPQTVFSGGLRPNMQKSKVSQIWDIAKRVDAKGDFETFTIVKGKNQGVLQLLRRFCFGGIRKIRNFYSNDPIEFSFRHRILCKGLKKNTCGKYYFFINLLRFISIAIVVTQFYLYPIVQICVFASVCLGFFIFICVSRPFETTLDMVLCIINEGLVMAALVSAVVLAWMDYKESLNWELKMNLGWVIVFTYLTLMYGLLINMLQKILRGGIFAGKKLWVKIKAKKTFPGTI